MGWIVAGLIICLQVFAQNPSKPRAELTWEELKRVHTQERGEILQAQKDAITKLLEMQKLATEALVSTKPTASEVIELNLKLADERKDVLKAQSDERVKITEIYSKERQSYRY